MVNLGELLLPNGDWLAGWLGSAQLSVGYMEEIKERGGSYFLRSSTMSHCIGLAINDDDDEDGTGSGNYLSGRYGNCVKIFSTGVIDGKWTFPIIGSGTRIGL